MSVLHILFSDYLIFMVISNRSMSNSEDVSYLKKWYLNLSIKYKLLILFYCFLLLFSFAFYLYNARVVYQNTLQTIGNANLNLLTQINANSSFMRSEVEDMSAQLIVSPEIQAYLTSGNASDTEKEYVDASVRDAVNLLISRGFVSSLSICDLKGAVPPFIRTIDNRFTMPDQSELIETELFRLAEQAQGRPVWLENSEDTYMFAANNHYNRIFMVRMIRDYDTYENIGLMVVGISEPTLRQEYSRGIDTSECGIAIYNSDGAEISSLGLDFSDAFTPEEIQSIAAQEDGYQATEWNQSTALLCHMTDEETGWVYLYMAPLQEMLNRINNSSNYIVPFVVSALIIVFPILLVTTDLIIRPIRKLLVAMRSVEEGDFSQKVSFRYRDEIGQLGMGYDKMLQNLSSLIDKVYVLQIREKEAELNALESQINPHFLYNTLDSIYWKAQMRGEEEIAEMVWILSQVFRACLRKGEPFSTVGNEFKLLEQYMRLQKLRCGEKFDYEIQLKDEQIHSQKIPKLILQPFVENAVYHGIEKEDRVGHICVTGELRGDRIYFQIQDNGQGMSPEQAKAISTNTELSDGRHYSAIHNIHERLNILYQGDYQIEVHSVPHQGTTFLLSIPLWREKT